MPPRPRLPLVAPYTAVTLPTVAPSAHRDRIAALVAGTVGAEHLHALRSPAAVLAVAKAVLDDAARAPRRSTPPRAVKLVAGFLEEAVTRALKARHTAWTPTLHTLLALLPPDVRDHTARAVASHLGPQLPVDDAIRLTEYPAVTVARAATRPWGDPSTFQEEVLARLRPPSRVTDVTPLPPHPVLAAILRHPDLPTRVARRLAEGLWALHGARAIQDAAFQRVARTGYEPGDTLPAPLVATLQHALRTDLHGWSADTLVRHSLVTPPDWPLAVSALRRDLYLEVEQLVLPESVPPVAQAMLLATLLDTSTANSQGRDSRSRSVDDANRTVGHYRRETERKTADPAWSDTDAVTAALYWREDPLLAMAISHHRRDALAFWEHVASLGWPLMLHRGFSLDRVTPSVAVLQHPAIRAWWRDAALKPLTPRDSAHARGGALLQLLATRAPEAEGALLEALAAVDAVRLPAREPWDEGPDNAPHPAEYFATWLPWIAQGGPSPLEPHTTPALETLVGASVSLTTPDEGAVGAALARARVVPLLVERTRRNAKMQRRFLRKNGLSPDAALPPAGGASAVAPEELPWDRVRAALHPDALRTRPSWLAETQALATETGVAFTRLLEQHDGVRLPYWLAQALTATMPHGRWGALERLTLGPIPEPMRATARQDRSATTFHYRAELHRGTPDSYATVGAWVKTFHYPLRHILASDHPLGLPYFSTSMSGGFGGARLVDGLQDLTRHLLEYGAFDDLRSAAIAFVLGTPLPLPVYQHAYRGLTDLRAAWAKGTVLRVICVVPRQAGDTHCDRYGSIESFPPAVTAIARHDGDATTKLAALIALFEGDEAREPRRG